MKINSNMSLVALKSGDAHFIKELMNRIYPPAYQHAWQDKGQWYLEEIYSQNQIENELLEQQAPWWLVEHNDQIIGMYRLILNKPLVDDPDKNAMQLHRIYIDPDFHGKGIGQVLMDFAEKKARQMNKDLIWLEALESQQPAIGFYKKNGYTTSGHFSLPYERLFPHLRGMQRMVKYL